ncbi:hypothetical protein CBS101457_006926 [Exobasidium rhododendri]|nr:hypothetical protein CBS101457_006926 [Exobasidium rhododendri]
MSAISLPIRRTTGLSRRWHVDEPVEGDATVIERDTITPPPSLSHPLALPPAQLQVIYSDPTDTSPILQCCKDDSSRQGVCCRKVLPTDQRTLISPEVIRDIIIGLSDGLTVPFALTAGLSSLGSSHFVVLAGVAELVSGAISMGVGGYFSAQAEMEHYRFRAREVQQRVQRSCPKELADEVLDVLEPYGASYKIASSLSAHLWEAEQAHHHQPPHVEHSSTRHALQQLFNSPSQAVEKEKKGVTQFLVRIGGGLEPVSPSRVYVSAVTIGFSYLVGGVIPLLPYIVIKQVRTALFVSIGITAGLLLAFGVIKQHYSGARTGFKGYTYGAVSTLLVGGVAAAASWGIVHAIESGHQS